MKSKLGIHVISVGSINLLDYWEIAKPQVAVILDHNPDLMRQLKSITPGCFMIGRLYVEEGEQVFLDNPEQRAEEWFNRTREYVERMRGIYDAWMSYNEPIIKTPEEAIALSKFTSTWGDLMKSIGIKSAAYSFATGNPELNLWEYLAEGLRHCDLLALHEYSCPTMATSSGWLCLRYRQALQQLPIDSHRPIVITETGIDGGVIPGGEYAQKGWKYFMDEATYLENLKWYDGE